MTCKIAFIGNLEEVIQFAEEIKKYFDDFEKEFQTNDKKLYEIIKTAFKVQFKCFDLNQIGSEDYLNVADIIILFTNPNDFLQDKNVTALKSINANNQHRFLIGNVPSDFNTSAISQQIFETMNILNFEKYFEKRSGNFLTEEQNVESLTILPDFPQKLFTQIKEMIIQIEDGDLHFILFTNSKSAKLVSSPNATGNVLIKSILNHDSTSYTVTEICDKSFANAKIESLSFETDSKVKRIGNYAFQRSSITALSIPDSLEEFERDWCNGVESLNDIKINENHSKFQYINGLLIDKNKKEIIFAQRKLEKVPKDIPAYIKTIGPSSFDSCKSIESFNATLPSLELVDYLAFANCESLVNFEISGAGKVTFSNNCFNFSSSLANVIIECQDLTIALNCFQLCNDIESLTFKAPKVTIDSNAILYCKNITDFIIHNESSIVIKRQGFFYLEKLSKIFLSTGHLTIFDDSFKDCPLISSVYLKAKNDICSDFMKDFRQLTEVTLTSSSTLTMTKSSLENLKKLKSIQLRTKNLVFEKGCFKNLESLTSIIIECENPIKFESDEFEGCVSLESFKCLKSQSDSIKETEKVDFSEKCFISTQKLKEVEITASDINFGSYCFSGLQNLKKVNLYCKKVYIQDNCFENCSLLDTFKICKLEQNEIIEKVKLSEKCFYNTQNLNKVKIKANKIKLGCKCFSKSKNVKEVYLKGKKVNMSDKCLNYCESLESFTIKKARKISIGSKQFVGSKNVKNIKISFDPNSASLSSLNLANDSFKGADKLDLFKVSGGSLTISNELMKCSSISKLQINAADCVTINANTFNGSKNLTEIDISSTKLIIFENCFNDNKALEKVRFNCYEINIHNNCFKNISKCNSIKFTNSNTITLDSCDFCNWKSLENIELTSLNELIIGKKCFTNFANLKNVSFYSKSITIGIAAFQSCPLLTSVKFVKTSIPIVHQYSNVPITFLPEIRTIKEIFINDESFNYCTGLTELIIEAEEKVDFGKKCFYKLTNLINICLPKEITTIGKNSFYNCKGILSYREITLDENKELKRRKEKYLQGDIDYKRKLKEQKKNKEEEEEEEKEKEEMEDPFFVSLKSNKKFDSFFVFGVGKTLVKRPIKIKDKEANESKDKETNENKDKETNENKDKETNESNNDESSKSKEEDYEIVEVMKPSLISMFPSRPAPFSDDELDQIISFCYPQGPIENPPHLPPHIRTDTYILTGFAFYYNKGKRIGVVLHFCIPPTANSFVGDYYDRSYPFCVCLLGDCPDISSHFTFLSEVIEPIVNSPTRFELPPDLIIPEELQNQTGNCIASLEIKPNSPYIALSQNVTSMNFLLPKLIEYYISNHHMILSQSEYLLYPTLQTILSFRIEEIVELVLCILLDLKVTFVSKDVNRTSFCVLAFTNLIKKIIKSRAIIILYLPFTMSEEIRSIIPTIAGHHEGYNKDVVQVLLDENRFVYSDYNVINIIRNSRYYKSLIEKANIIFQNHLGRNISPIIKIPDNRNLNSDEFVDHFQNANRTILPTCFQYFVRTNYILTKEFIYEFSNLFVYPFFRKLKECMLKFYVTDTTNPDQSNSAFDHEMFLSSIPEEVDRSFIDIFTGSSIFENFKEELGDEVEKSKKPKEIANKKKEVLYLQDKKNISSTIEIKLSKKRSSSCIKTTNKPFLLS